MANPYVTNHLEFYPHDSQGTIVNSLKYSFKWREDIPREYRVQMVAINSKHFYIYEPTQLFSGEVVVPIFFYKSNNVMYAKCIYPEFLDKPDSNGIYVTIPSKLNFSTLMTINTCDFDLIYSEIKMENGQYLSKLCGDMLFGK